MKEEQLPRHRCVRSCEATTHSKTSPFVIVCSHTQELTEQADEHSTLRRESKEQNTLEQEQDKRLLTQLHPLNRVLVWAGNCLPESTRSKVTREYQTPHKPLTKLLSESLSTHFPRTKIQVYAVYFVLTSCLTLSLCNVPIYMKRLDNLVASVMPF